MRRLDDFDRKGWHNVCELRQGPTVEYVGLTNREDDDEDRVVVRMEAVLRDVVIDRGGAVINRNNSDSESTTLAEYWTLGRAGDRWILLSIEQDAEGAHHLDAPIVASPWSDEARLQDEAVTELAVADATPDAEIGELVDVDYAGDGRAQALDLSRGRRALRPRGAGGGRAARGRGVGGGGRRRRRRARARGHAGGGARAALPAAARTRGSSSAARACRRSGSSRSSRSRPPSPSRPS